MKLFIYSLLLLSFYSVVSSMIYKKDWLVICLSCSFNHPFIFNVTGELKRLKNPFCIDVKKGHKELYHALAKRICYEATSYFLDLWA